MVFQSEISQETRFDESTDLSTTYLGKGRSGKKKCNKSGGKFSNLRTRVYTRQNYQTKLNVVY